MTAAQRKEVLRRKAALLPKAEAEQLLERFAQLPQVESAQTVMVFCGVGREPDTDGLIRTLLARGQRVALPVCLPGRRLEARVISDMSQLVPGRFGIPEPDYSCPKATPGEIGAVLVPGLMADREGYRLGYGGGYYDRWLADYRGTTVGMCYKEVLQQEVPRDEHDLPVKILLCIQ